MISKYFKKRPIIVINTGVPKSGTTLLQQYQVDIIKTYFKQNALNEIMKYGYNITQFSEVNNRGFFPNIDKETNDLFENIQAKFGSFVAKTHCLPNTYTENLVNEHNAKITCCYRDPRDIILSTIDHGVRTRNGIDKSGAYMDVFNIDDGILRIKKWINIYLEWEKQKSTLMIKYEDLMDDKIRTILNVSDFLKIKISKKDVYTIYDKHEKIKESAWNFNNGTTYRWKTEMNQDDIRKCNMSLNDEIIKMGYKL